VGPAGICDKEEVIILTRKRIKVKRKSVFFFNHLAYFDGCGA
jgi:hypothetical protein